MSEERPSQEERQQAEALARALEGKPAADAPDDALQAADLLRLSRAGELTDERQETLWERLEAGLPRERRPGLRRRLAGWRWLLPVGSLLAAAALLLVLLLPGPPAPAGAPRPEPALLRLQARAASGSSRAARELAFGMRDYRQKLYARLDARYGEQP